MIALLHISLASAGRNGSPCTDGSHEIANLFQPRSHSTCTPSGEACNVKDTLLIILHAIYTTIPQRAIYRLTDAIISSRHTEATKKKNTPSAPAPSQDPTAKRSPAHQTQTYPTKKTTGSVQHTYKKGARASAVDGRQRGKDKDRV